MFPRLLWLLSGVVLAACGSGEGDAVPPALPPSSGNWHGYFLGTATVAGSDRYGEALVTADGAVRVHISGPAGPEEGSVQFVGRRPPSGGLTGTGEVLGQHCGRNPGRFCAARGAAEIRITRASRTLLSGEIRVTTDAGARTWPFSMHRASTFRPSYVIPDHGAGLYLELLAEFSEGDELTVSVNGDGEMFFQSATTGCMGNGALESRSSGTVLAYDATLAIEGCSGDYAHLNGEFGGLAVRTLGEGPLGVEASWLVVWLSSRAPAPPVAVTMWGNDLGCGGCWDY